MKKVHIYVNGVDTGLDENYIHRVLVYCLYNHYNFSIIFEEI